MLPPKEFLEQQFRLVDEGIKDALRHEYGPAESNLFFDECQTRLNSWEAAAQLLPTPSPKDLAGILNGLSNLGALVNRIQRSRLGEFPWAFAEELRTLASDLCKSQTGRAPLFFFSSDGLLEDYGVYDEQENLSLFVTPIFNIVFPRTLKHQVLVHPVLAHEIGHAFLSIPKAETLKHAVESALFNQGSLASTARFKKWLAGWNLQMAKYSDADLDEILSCWREEISCDLVGLLLMGPCFVPAFLSVLGALDPTTTEVDPEHPPPVCRFFAQHVAIQELGWLGGRHGRQVQNAQKQLWRGIARFARHPHANSLVTAQSIRTTVRLIKRRLQGSSALFEARNLRPLRTLLRQILNLVPPVGAQDIEKSIPAGSVDFRAILYAGWLAWEKRRGKSGRPTFDDVNRLCELAILQQRGIACALAGDKRAL